MSTPTPSRALRLLWAAVVLCGVAGPAGGVRAFDGASSASDDRGPLPMFKNPKAALRAGLDRAVEEHRELGCCTSFGDWQETVCAIAVGFHPGGGLPPMSVNCGAPTVITDARFLMEVARPASVGRT